MTSSLPVPFGGPSPRSEPLANAPLVCMLAQVRFSRILKIEQPAGVSDFQDRLFQEYPDLTSIEAQGMRFVLTQTGTPEAQQVTTRVWRFQSQDGTFIASLTSETLTLETKSYPGRKVFLGKWHALLEVMQAVYVPAQTSRTAVRYINRIADKPVEEVASLVNPALVGVAAPDFFPCLSQTLSEASFTVDEGGLTLRWGIIPPQHTIDPNLLDGVAEKSWLIDMDVFSAEARPFRAADLRPVFENLAARAYSVFHWALTPAGRIHYRRILAR
ncbi:hypothetical protein A0J51_02982 [Gluconobacter japonicus]|nr:hypothetical protein A0J51_02982 [Gluconobacter japonicus]